MKKSKKYGPWIIHHTDQIYRDAFIDVTLDQVTRPDGKPGQHVKVELKPGVCVLAIDDQRQVHLTQEFHYGVGRNSLEAVSGGIESGEDALRCAQRELQEEIGLQADSWQLLSWVDPFTTVVVSPTLLYLAKGLREVSTSPEGTEQIERVVLPLEEAVSKVISGEITHAPTCVLLLLAAREKMV